MIPLLLLAPQSLPEELASYLSHPSLKGSMASLHVTKLDGTVIYSKNSSQLLVPASNQKILSCTFALHELGPNYRPETRFWILPNKITIHGDGDPSLTNEYWSQIRQKLAPEGRSLVEICAPFRPLTPPGWEKDDLPHRYGAKVSWITIDQGGFEVIWDGKKPNVDAYTGVQVEYKEGKRDLTYDPFAALLTVTGSFTPTEGYYERFALPNPEESIARILGGQAVHTIHQPLLAPNYVSEGPPLKEIVQDCLEESDNIMAESLLLMATAAERSLTSDPYSIAQKELEQFLSKEMGIGSDQVSVSDGSGLSRHNLITTSALARILRYCYASETRDEFLKALPEPGEGTLKHRLKGVNVQAKTGSIDRVSALSGYVFNGKGNTLVFSMIFNNYSVSGSRIKSLEDQIVKALATNRNW